MSRRALIASSAAAAPALAALHETIPHQGLHDALGGHPDAAAAEPMSMGGHAGHVAAGAVSHDGFGSGTVDNAANGFDPSEVVRDFDYGETSRLPTGASCASGRSSPRTGRSRSRPG